MSLIEVEAALGNALEGGRVRRKANNTGKLRQAQRVVKGSPEVMVKITGFGRGADHIKAHLSYVTRHAKLELETDRGDLVRGKEGIKDLLLLWTEDLRNSPRHKNQRDTMHMVLSMPEGTPETAVRNAARAYAKRVFSANHEYVFALHTDEPHPHVHLTVKMLGFDRTRLNPRKADLQLWREAFAREMRDQGVDAEATPRSTRGVVRKAENSVVRHIERGGDGRPPRISRVTAARHKAIVEELIAETNGQLTVEMPWEPRIKQRQALVRDAWQTAATALETYPTSLKEHRNVRPEYDQLDPDRLHAGQRAAAVYQSNVEELTLRAPAVALARLRDLSSLDLVQHQRPAQVLLHPDAPDCLGRDGGPDNDLRRPRTRTLTFARATRGDDGRGHGVGGAIAASQTLAEKIRQFVQAMPAIDTQRHELKRRLASQFPAHRAINGPEEERAPLPNPTRDVPKTHER